MSNFELDELAELTAMARIQPALVQRFSDPFQRDAEVLAFCHLASIQYQARPPACQIPMSSVLWLVGSGPLGC